MDFNTNKNLFFIKGEEFKRGFYKIIINNIEMASIWLNSIKYYQHGVLVFELDEESIDFEFKINDSWIEGKSFIMANEKNEKIIISREEENINE